MELNGTKPIFEQIAEHFEKLIFLGVYQEDDFLPSVREFSLENKVNPNTVQHGYSLLVDKGLVISIPKKGYQVKKSIQKNLDIIDQTLKKLLNLGYTINEIEDSLEKIKKEQTND